MSDSEAILEQVLALESAAARAATRDQAVGHWLEVAALRRERLGDVDGAIAALRRAAQVQPTHRIMLNRYAQVCASAERWTELVDVLDMSARAARSDDERARVLAHRGDILGKRLGRIAEARSTYREVSRLAHDPALAAAAREAVERIDTILSPPRGSGQRERTFVGRVRGATEAPPASISERPSAVDERAEHVGRAARVALEEGRHVEARALVEQSLALRPWNEGALRVRRDLLRAERRWDELLRLLVAESEELPSPFQASAALNDAADVAADALGDVDAALALHQRALAYRGHEEVTMARAARLACRHGVYDALARLKPELAAEQRAAWIEQLAAAAAGAGDAQTALELRALGFEDVVTDVAFFQARVQVLERKGDVAGVQAALVRRLRVATDPDERRAMAWELSASCEAQGRWREAVQPLIELITTAVRDDEVEEALVAVDRLSQVAHDRGLYVRALETASQRTRGRVTRWLLALARLLRDELLDVEGAAAALVRAASLGEDVEAELSALDDRLDATRIPARPSVDDATEVEGQPLVMGVDEPRVERPSEPAERTERMVVELGVLDSVRGGAAAVGPVVPAGGAETATAVEDDGADALVRGVESDEGAHDVSGVLIDDSLGDYVPTEVREDRARGVVDGVTSPRDGEPADVHRSGAGSVAAVETEGPSWGDAVGEGHAVGAPRATGDRGVAAVEAPGAEVGSGDRTRGSEGAASETVSPSVSGASDAGAAETDERAFIAAPQRVEDVGRGEAAHADDGAGRDAGAEAPPGTAPTGGDAEVAPNPAAPVPLGGADRVGTSLAVTAGVDAPQVPAPDVRGDASSEGVVPLHAGAGRSAVEPAAAVGPPPEVAMHPADAPPSVDAGVDAPALLPAASVAPAVAGPEPPAPDHGVDRAAETVDQPRPPPDAHPLLAPRAEDLLANPPVVEAGVVPIDVDEATTDGARRMPTSEEVTDAGRRVELTPETDAEAVAEAAGPRLVRERPVEAVVPAALARRIEPIADAVIAGAGVGAARWLAAGRHAVDAACIDVAASCFAHGLDRAREDGAERVAVALVDAAWTALEPAGDVAWRGSRASLEPRAVVPELSPWAKAARRARELDGLSGRALAARAGAIARVLASIEAHPVEDAWLDAAVGADPHATDAVTTLYERAIERGDTAEARRRIAQALGAVDPGTRWWLRSAELEAGAGHAARAAEALLNALEGAPLDIEPARRLAELGADHGERPWLARGLEALLERYLWARAIGPATFVALTRLALGWGTAGDRLLADVAREARTGAPPLDPALPEERRRLDGAFALGDVDALGPMLDPGHPDGRRRLVLVLSPPFLLADLP